jgi:hypothetical protein
MKQMQVIINLFNLKPGADAEEFKKWSKKVDQRTAPSQKGVYSLKVVELKKNDKGVNYQFAEIIKVLSNEAWEEALKTDEMIEVVQQWSKWGDSSSLVSWYGDLF